MSRVITIICKKTELAVVALRQSRKYCDAVDCKDGIRLVVPGSVCGRERENCCQRDFLSNFNFYAYRVN